MFDHTLTNAIRFQTNKLQPPPSFYIIYGILYIWNLIWVLWSQSMIFQEQNDGCFRISPPVLTISFYCNFIILILCFTLWMFILDQNYAQGCVWILFLLAICTFVALSSLSVHLNHKQSELLENFEREFWIIKVFAQNGVAGVLSVSLFEVCCVSNYLVTANTSVSENAASNSFLTLLCAILIIYFVLDFLVFEKLFRFVICPYLCFIWFGCNLLVKTINTEVHEDLDEDSSQVEVFCIAITVIAAVLALVRLAHACFYQFIADDIIDEEPIDLQSKDSRDQFNDSTYMNDSCQ